MRVTRIVCTQWRNLADQTIPFSPGVNVLVGENGQGKTNVLEAIQFFKFGRSFRTHRDTELVRFGAPFARVEVACERDGLRDSHGPGTAGTDRRAAPAPDPAAPDVPAARETFTAAIDPSGSKKITIAGNEIDRLSELVGQYPCVLFGPQDLAVASGEPALRRRFVDAVGSMVSPLYIQAARDYQRVLRQRNAALKSRATEHELNIWNTQLAAAGADLIQRRADLVRVLETEMTTHARELDTTFEFALSYESTVLREAQRMAAGAEPGDAVPSLADVFAIKLGALEAEERRRCTTLVGPHRDDIAVRMNARDLRKFGSQGQRRLFAILMKLSELSILERELNERCVLLLDDVFSEFDETMTTKLQRLLDGSRQVFVTSPVALRWAGEANVFSVRDGHVQAGAGR